MIEKQQPSVAPFAVGMTGLPLIRIPTLFIGGDHDDVADFTRGIRPAFQEAVNSDLCLLAYEKRPWAVGLEMHCYAAGQQAAAQ